MPLISSYFILCRSFLVNPKVTWVGFMSGSVAFGKGVVATSVNYIGRAISHSIKDSALINIKDWPLLNCQLHYISIA